MSQQPPENQGSAAFLDDMLRHPDAVSLDTAIAPTPIVSQRRIDPGMFRMVIDLPVELAQVLDQMVRRNGVSHAETVRRAIVTANFIEDRLAYGTMILMQEPDGRLLRMHRRDGVPIEEGPSSPVVIRSTQLRRRTGLFRRRG
jgi:hypothetical protein